MLDRESSADREDVVRDPRPLVRRTGDDGFRIATERFPLHDAAMGESLPSQNRPVHLARRDTSVERAAEMLNVPLDPLSTAERLDYIGREIELLEGAVNHARLAGRSGGVSQREKDFLHFLVLILGNVQSAHAFLRNQAHLESEEHSFLTHYLGIAEDEVDLTATIFRRRSEDIIAGLWQLLRMAHGPYRMLQAENLAEMDETGRSRYETACARAREYLVAHYPLPAPPDADPSPVTVGPTALPH